MWSKISDSRFSSSKLEACSRECIRERYSKQTPKSETNIVILNRIRLAIPYNPIFAGSKIFINDNKRREIEVAKKSKLIHNPKITILLIIFWLCKRSASTASEYFLPKENLETPFNLSFLEYGILASKEMSVTSLPRMN